ncbi:hypothetical protein LUZ63_005671 [Rhynchospora breviuscula]|uniref:TF-B3 domain-containing protein n=1 Tax=Rhynchospora breviuscula TaxID=2022672 RepID=A0A9Q0CPH1_9POAL|nr:hypothetical protein LUZ63_005671 [Rhynchospora breviuscula]
MKHKKSSSSTLKTNPHFFKFLFPDAFAILRIPKKFYKHLPTVLPKRASLVTQICKIWRVNVHQNEEGICFSSGWSEFVKAHDLQLGYFLLFRYEGKMVFSVKVFDTTCCLKDYALTPCEPKQPTFESSKMPNLKCWTGGRQQTACNRKNSYTLGSEKTTKRITGNTDPVTECERTIAQYHISSAYMNFPGMFCKQNGLTSSRTMKLKDSENHVWTMNFNYNSFDGRLASGWINFTKKNGLKVGDKLKFKVLAPDTMLVLRCRRVRDI